MPFHENVLNTHRMSLNICTLSIFFLFVMFYFFSAFVTKTHKLQKCEPFISLFFPSFKFVLFIRVNTYKFWKYISSLILENLYFRNESVQNKANCNMFAISLLDFDTTLFAIFFKVVHV